MKSISLTGIIAASLVGVVLGLGQESTPPASSQVGHPSTCAPTAFLTFEQGRLASVDWVEKGASKVHTHAVLTQSFIMDATIDLRPDQTASHAAATMTKAGDEPMQATPHDLGKGAIYWSTMIVSSLEQAVARARILNQPSSRIPGVSPFSATRSELVVDRLDPTDWIVSFQDKHYQVATDEQGCMISATLPEYGVTVERRSGFSPEQYPLWPPYAAPPDGAYRAVEVSIRAPQGHVLAGTLTIPSREETVPAVVLITGLSPHERNNGEPPWMPFRDIADALTRAGVAVLRVDDRGVGKSTGDRAPSTTFDEADDVRTEVAWLRSHEGIDPKRIALVGYSEGGLIAPMVAANDASIAAIITLAGPGVSGSEVARYQVEQGVLHDPGIAPAGRERAIAKSLAEALKDLTPRESTFLTIDPLAYARQVRCPALIVQGGADTDVPIRSAERIAAAMRSSGNADVTVRIFPGVSHSFLPDPIGPGRGWVYLPGFLTAPDLVREITQWSVSKLIHSAKDQQKKD